MKEFIEKWEGKVVDYDGYYWYQCTDFVRQYCLEMFWETYKPHWNAWTLYDQDWGDEYIKYPFNSAQFIPNRWDIVIFKWPTKYGHIGVITDAEMMSFTVIDQNTWSGNWDWEWDNKIRIQYYWYSDVIWFVRNLNYTSTDDVEYNQYTNILDTLIKDGYEPVFNDYGWSDWETKTLIDIGLARTEEKWKNKLNK